MASPLAEAVVEIGDAAERKKKKDFKHKSKYTVKRKRRWICTLARQNPDLETRNVTELRSVVHSRNLNNVAEI